MLSKKIWIVLITNMCFILEEDQSYNLLALFLNKLLVVSAWKVYSLVARHYCWLKLKDGTFSIRKQDQFYYFVDQWFDNFFCIKKNYTKGLMICKNLMINIIFKSLIVLSEKWQGNVWNTLAGLWILKILTITNLYNFYYSTV